MRSYNGFSSAERMLVVPIQREAYETGYAKRPSRCCVCGTTKGSFTHHTEDYTPELGPHLFEYPMCYTCHMVIHCRFRGRDIWDLYREKIRQGLRVAEVITGWPVFRAKVLQRFDDLEWEKMETPLRLVLDEIETAKRDPED